MKTQWGAMGNSRTDDTRRKRTRAEPGRSSLKRYLAKSLYQFFPEECWEVFIKTHSMSLSSKLGFENPTQTGLTSFARITEESKVKALLCLDRAL